MNVKSYIMIAASAAVVLATSCSGNDEEQAVGQGLVPITLTASVADGPEATRTVGNVVQESLFPNQTTFYAFFPSGACIGDATSSCGTVFTNNGSGGTHPSHQPFFNDDATQTTVSAYYPYSAGGKQVTNATTSFSVETDQTTEANYKASDLLYATATVTKESPTAELNFTHQLSRIIVKMKTSGITANVSVTLNNTMTTTALNDGRPADSPSPRNSATITMGTVTATSADYSYLSAIIIPQTLAEGTTFLTFDVKDYGTFTYEIPAGGKQFSSGHSYTYDVTVTSTHAIMMSVSIEDWNTVNRELNFTEN